MTQSQRFQEWQPGDVRRVPLADRDQLIVSTTNIEGNSHILSRYGDAVWQLPSTTTNAEARNKGLDFTVFPEEFAAVMKAITYRYLHRGREGQVRPSSGTLVSFHGYGGTFLRFLKKMKITRLADVTPLVCNMYVDHAKATRILKSGTPLRPTTLILRFLAVEAIYELSQYTDDPVKMAPWPDATAGSLSGVNGTTREDKALRGRTPLIPDDVFVAMFKAAWTEVTSAPRLLDLRDELDRVALEIASRDRHVINATMTRHLCMRQWEGDLTSFKTALLGIRMWKVITSRSSFPRRRESSRTTKSRASFKRRTGYPPTRV